MENWLLKRGTVTFNHLYLIFLIWHPHNPVHLKHCHVIYLWHHVMKVMKVWNIHNNTETLPTEKPFKSNKLILPSIVSERSVRLCQIFMCVRLMIYRSLTALALLPVNVCCKRCWDGFNIIQKSFRADVDTHAHTLIHICLAHLFKKSAFHIYLFYYVKLVGTKYLHNNCSSDSFVSKIKKTCP